MRTPRGRAATQAAYRHLGLTPPRSAEDGGSAKTSETAGEEPVSVRQVEMPVGSVGSD